MPFMEDLPAILPISIAFALIITSLSWQFTDYFNKTNALSLQRAVQSVAEQLVYENHGVFGLPAGQTSWPQYAQTLTSVYPNLQNLQYLIRTDGAPIEREEFPVVVSLPVVYRKTNGETEAGRLYVAGGFR